MKMLSSTFWKITIDIKHVICIWQDFGRFGFDEVTNSPMFFGFFAESIKYWEKQIKGKI